MNAPPAPGPTLSAQLEWVAEALTAIQSGRSLTTVFPRVPAALRQGVQALTFDVLRAWGRAQALRACLVPKAPPAKVRVLLDCALALLSAPPESSPYPAHTLVSQAVEAVKRRSAPHASFFNAVLRRFEREREALLSAVLQDPVARWNHPAWWIGRLECDWPAHATAILEADGLRPPMTLRVRAGIATASAYIDALAQQGLRGWALGPQTVVLAEPAPVAALPGFERGEVSVQDAAAQRAAPLLLGPSGLRPGARVLDACAAPGGKTAHLLELAPDLDLLALDADAKRLEKVSDNLHRLGLQAELRAADAGDPASWWDGRFFDAILLDAPCTGSGIVRRHPDIPWLRRPTDPADLARQQSRLLDALWPLLAPGGRLLYATCSVFKAEGQDQIDAFLQRTAGVRAAGSPGHLLPLPDNGATDLPTGAHRTADGFFYGLLEKDPAG